MAEEQEWREKVEQYAAPVALGAAFLSGITQCISASNTLQPWVLYPALALWALAAGLGWANTNMPIFVVGAAGGYSVAIRLFLPLSLSATFGWPRLLILLLGLGGLYWFTRQEFMDRLVYAGMLVAAAIPLVL